MWIVPKDGFFERTDVGIKEKIINCVSFLDSGDLVTGDREGLVSIYSVSNEGEYFMSHEFKAHEMNNGVSAIVMLNDTTMVTAGSKDRTVVAWDPMREFAKMAEVTVNESMGSPKTIQPQKHDQKSGDTRYAGTKKLPAFGPKFNCFPKLPVELIEQSCHEMINISVSTWEQTRTASWRARCSTSSAT